VNFPLSVSAAEEKKAETAELAEDINNDTENAEDAEEAEEDTMLNIMPSLSIPKTPSLQYAIAQKFEYNDNFYLEKKDKKKGRFSSITSPTVSLTCPIGRTYLEGNYDYQFTYYMREQETLSRQEANIKIYHRPTRRFSVGLTEQFLRNNLPDQDDPIDVKVAGKTFDRNKLAAEIKYEINRKWRIGADGSYNFIYFKEWPSDAIPENIEFSGGINTEYVIDRRTTLGLFYDFSDAIFLKDQDQKGSVRHDMQIRYSHRIQKAFAVDTYAGYNLIAYDTGDDVTGAVAGTDLRFDISRFTQFAIGYDYGLNNSLKKDNLVYRSHSFHVNLDHNITPRLAVNARSSYNVWRYDSKYAIINSGSAPDRQSEVIRFECGLNYKLTKKIDIGATYNTSSKFSDFSNDAYYNNIYLATLRASF
jgi:hypothetical protein